MSLADDEFPDPEAAAEIAQQKMLSTGIPNAHVGTAMLWTSVGTLIVTFLWIIFCLVIPRDVHLFVVRPLAGIGVLASAILALVASCYRSDALALFVFEFFLLGLCLFW